MENDYRVYGFEGINSFDPLMPKVMAALKAGSAEGMQEVEAKIDAVKASLEEEKAERYKADTFEAETRETADFAEAEDRRAAIDAEAKAREAGDKYVADAIAAETKVREDEFKRVDAKIDGFHPVQP